MYELYDKDTALRVNTHQSYGSLSAAIRGAQGYLVRTVLSIEAISIYNAVGELSGTVYLNGDIEIVGP
jgi:hypothetical protein